MTTVEYEIYLPKPIEGEALVAAVQQTAGKEFSREGMIVGQGSSYPYRDCVIAVGKDFATTMVKAGRSYTCLAVQDHSWGGMKFLVGFSDDDVVEAVKEFRDKLEGTLATALNVPLEDIQRLTKLREGMVHGDARYACDHCNNGLATNLGPCPHCGAPIGSLTALW